MTNYGLLVLNISICPTGFQCARAAISASQDELPFEERLASPDHIFLDACMVALVIDCSGHLKAATDNAATAVIGAITTHYCLQGLVAQLGHHVLPEPLKVTIPPMI